MMKSALPLLFGVVLLAAPKAIFPPGVKPVGPYSPGLDAGDLVYVSGQGARDAQNQLPSTPEAQVKQTLENVKAVLQASGLTMEHVVYAQTYLADIKHYDLMNRVWSQYFPKNPPARSTIGVARMPTETPFEVSAIAVRDLKAKRVVQHPERKMPVPVSPAIVVKDRAFLTGGLGRNAHTGVIPKEPRAQVKLIMDQTATVLRGAGLDMRHLAYVNIYVTPSMPMKELALAVEEYIPEDAIRTVIQTASLPFGVHLQISGVASREVKRLGNCSAIGDTAYCAGRGGTITQALSSLKQDLDAAKLSFANVVASNVYVDNLDEFGAMNKIYATYFSTPYPTRTTVQPWKAAPELNMPPATGAPVDNSPRAMVSVIAVR